MFSYVLFGTYIGIGALAHDFGFSLTWSMLCTLLVWAGPAQVILISSLGGGATVLAAGIAVCISSVRLLPMVVALLPMLKRRHVRMAAGGAGAFHRRQHVGRGAAAAAGPGAREPHRVLQRAWHRLPYHRHAGDLHGLLSRRQAAAARERRAAVPHAARVPDVDIAQQPHADRLPLARLRPGARPAVRAYASEFDLMWSGLVAGTAAYIIHRICARHGVSVLSGEHAAYLALILAGFLPNEVWRFLGVMFASGLDEGSEILVWVRAVATAILAGVIAKTDGVCAGRVATVPMSVRVAAVLIGFLGFLAIRRSVFAGVIVGEIALVVGALLFGA